uniref:Uncharacterized protein n=1 Tax=Ciona intestinalis TaxID=7719 RepID=H2XWE6_CIOIN
ITSLLNICIETGRAAVKFAKCCPHGVLLVLGNVDFCYMSSIVLVHRFEILQWH